MRARDTWPSLNRPVELGNTGISVSPLCVGMTSDPDTVCVAYERGVNFFFVTADLHWELYEQTRIGLRKLSRSAREELVVAVVTYMTHPYVMRTALDEGAAGLGVPEATYMAIAGASHGADVVARVAQLRRFVGRSRWQASGVTFHDHQAALVAAGSRMIDVGMVRYSAADTAAATELFSELPDSDSPALFSFKTTTGHTSDVEGYDISDHYRFVLSHTPLDGILCAPQSPDQLDATVQALERGPLTRFECAALIDAATGLGRPAGDDASMEERWT